MSRANRYKWLIVVEGNTDVKTYSNLLTEYGANKGDFNLISANSKGRVCNTAVWNNILVAQSNLCALIIHDVGRADFCGVILLIDSDTNNIDAFCDYKRNPRLSYIEQDAPTIENRGTYWFIDTLKGTKPIHIYGINVPINSTGCMETDLLASYGFPVEGQIEYANIVDAIQKASGYWQIPKHGDGKNWWEENRRAKLDKFIYSAFSRGFKVSGEIPTLPNEPDVIQNIQKIIGTA